MRIYDPLMGLICAFLPCFAQASSLWTCDVTIRASGADSVTIVENKATAEGPCADYKAGQTYPLTPVLEPNGVYAVQILIPEHRDIQKDGAKASAPQWVVKPPAQPGSK